MNKITFLNELEYELDKLSRTERDQIMYHYEGVFYEAEKQNRSEEDVLRELETPKKIAKKYYAKYAINHAEDTPNTQNILRAIFATVGLSIFSLLFVLIPVIIATLLLIIILFIAIIFILAPVLLFVANVISDFNMSSLTNYLFSFAYMGLGIVFMIVAFKFASLVYRLILRYLNWNIRTIRGNTSV